MDSATPPLALSESDTELNESPLPPLIKSNSFYSKWLNSDRIFDGQFSSGSETPVTAHLQQTTVPRRELPGKFFRRSSQESFPEDFAVPILSPQNSLNTCSRFETDYEVLERIGSGHFGNVFKCRSKLDGNLYAVKQIELTKRLAKTEAVQEAFALAASSVCDDNTHIIRYHSVWYEDNSLYIVTELARCSLPQYLAREGPSQKTVLTLLRDLAKGLKKLHAHNIVHMDIKADNILYSFSNKFKLADLGLARVTTNLTGEIPEGDARYLAPEVLMTLTNGQVPDLAQADIFSLGATLYEIMRRKVLPMNGEEWNALRTGAFCVPGDFDPALKQLVKQMMHQDASRRPSAAEILQQGVISVENGEIQRWKDYAHQLECEIEQLRAELLK